MLPKPLSIALAAGGTGGHLFPAVALAQELVARGYAVNFLADPRGATFNAGVTVRSVSAARLTGGPLAKTVGALRLVQGMLESAWFLQRDRVRLLVGFGGYPSVPPVLAAKLLGVPVLLHEQNAVLGRANRYFAKFARQVATSFPAIESLPASAVSVLTGTPVRAEVVAARDQMYLASTADEPFHLLVFGGSQGAHVFSEIVPAACALLPEPLQARLRIVQQARAEDQVQLQAAYKALAIEAEIAPFFHNLPARIAAAQLVVARAGASTIAELLGIGRPAVLVPYPYAIDDHQTANARAADAAGTAWLMPQSAFTAEALAQRLETVLTLPTCAARRAGVAYSLGRPDAAARLADAAESILLRHGNVPAQAPRSLAA